MPDLDLTVASGDDLSVRRFVSQESVSELFSVSVYAMSSDPNLDLDRIIGKPATFRAKSGYAHAELGGARYWTGTCSFVELVKGNRPGAGEAALNEYHVTIVPDLWRLTHRRGNRIYQHLSIPDIVDKLLAEWRQEAVWEIERGNYPKLEYKVQYGESDYHFVSRLLEEAGICFTFPDDDKAGSKLTFSDELHHNKARAAAPIHYVDNPSTAAEKEYVTNLRITREVRPGAHVIRDYDHRSPAFQLFGESTKIPPEDVYEQYHYTPGMAHVEGGSGGGTPVADDKSVARRDQKYATNRAEIALHAERTGRAKVLFETNTVDLWPGMITTFEQHPHADLGTPILMTEFVIEGNVEGEEWLMRGEAVFSDVTYRPPLSTDKPRIYGVQSATVAGPKGQEIYTDEFGRVRVQFPWDREGRSNDDSSVWMRVSQGWAGTGFGMINIPRIGQEVLVGFLDGDPDQPIIVGRVFNAVEQVPYKLPKNKTVSGWKTNTSPGGGGYNEIKLEDKAGLELFYVQAQRNYDELIKKDETARTLGHHKKTVVLNQDLVVKQNKRELVEMDDHLHVLQNRLQKIDQSTSLTVGVDQHEKVGRLHALEAGEEIHLKAGARVVMEAGARFTIQGPGGFIDIHKGGIDIVGKIVNINSGGSAGKGAGAKPKLPSDPQEAEPTDHSH